MTATATFWGVDSAAAANSGPVGSHTTLYDAVVSPAGAGRTPAFWGRYIGHPTTRFNLTPGEADFLLGRDCRIVLIYGGTTSATVGTYQQGVDHATTAINYLASNSLAVPEDDSVWIYCDTEYPSMSPTADFFRGWSDTMFSSSYGGAGGVYGNTSVIAAPQFNTPYCKAYAADSNMREVNATALLWANQPNQCAGASCHPPTLAGSPPGFSIVNVPPCGAPTVIYQYAINLTIAGMRDAVDFDLANDVGFASMW
jgi:glycoside hydrolase-like protein